MPNTRKRAVRGISPAGTRRAVFGLLWLLSAPSVLAQAALTRDTLSVGGVIREFYYFAAGGDSASGAPLVIVLHGGRSSAKGAAERFGFTEVAGGAGAIVVYPEGIGHQWSDGRDYFHDADDVGFIRALVAAMEQRLHVDRRRIFAAGHSNGAILAYTLACRLPGVFAAIGTVGGALAEHDVARCEGAHAISVIAIHGVADPLVPYTGGGLHGTLIGALASAAFWGKVDGCSATPSRIDLPNPDANDRTRATRIEYSACHDGRAVKLYAIEGGGHGWPSRPDPNPESVVGPRSNAVDATTIIWEFFATHAAKLPLSTSSPPPARTPPSTSPAPASASPAPRS